MSLKIAVIGAGSIGFTRKLMQDLLGVPEFGDTVFAFTDLNPDNLDRIAQLARRDIAANHLPAQVITTLDRRAALDGADYVMSVVRIGGLEAFQTDIEIPLKYGVDQCVGDTLCAGGIMYGQRNIAAILDFCRDIRACAKPGALFFNYANPMCMNVWAANRYGGVTTIGLCHGVQGGHHQIAAVIELLVNEGRQPDDPAWVPVAKKDVDIICAGINHQTWYIKVQYRGSDWTGRLLEGFQKHPTFQQTEKVRIDILKRFGYYSTESNGHLSEYVPWYRKRTGEIAQWIDLSSWINGETGGYLRVSTEGRQWFETDFPAWLAEKPPVFGPSHRSEEHVSYIIEGLQTGRVYRGHFNVPNNGCIANLPADAIIEVPGYVDRNGINIPRVGDLPLGCAAVCNASISVQRLAVEAAVHGDVSLLKQAMMMDPLVGAVCNPAEISQLTDEMLVAQAAWLPQYATVIPEAKSRLATEKPLGTRVTAGAARLPVKSPEEIAQAIAARHLEAKEFESSPLLPLVEPIEEAVPPPAATEFRPVPTHQTSEMVYTDFREVHRGATGLIYLRTRIAMEQAGPGVLFYGADGPAKVWVNGLEAGCAPRAINPIRKDQYRAEVQWRQGTNDILIAILTKGRAWGATARAAWKE